MKRVALLMALAVVGGGCGGERITQVGGNDAAVTPRDAGSRDGGEHDAGEPDAGLPDAGCDKPCGAVCCGEDEFCNGVEVCEPICVPACEGKQCGDDGCGQPCGFCDSTEQCNPVTFQCDCVPEADAALCANLDLECGTVRATDRCGAERTLECGHCTDPWVCNPDNHKCDLCVAETDAELCAAANANCGRVTRTDRCGVLRTVASDCGTCQYNEDCVASRCELCVPESDADFCADRQVQCGSATGTDRCRNPGRTVAECGPCAAGLVCDAHACINPAANDDCTTARALVFDATGHATALGDTTNATDSGSSDACLGGSGLDLVFSFTTSATASVTVSALFSPAGSAHVDAVLSVRGTCLDKSTEIACTHRRQDATTATAPATLELHQLPAGTWYVWVDSYSTSGNDNKGPFVLDVQLSAAGTPPANDTCASPESIILTNGTATVAGDTTFATDDATGSCIAKTSPMTGGEVIYSVTLPGPAVLSARVERDPDPSQAGFQPAVYIRDDCTSALPVNELACVRHTAGIAAAATGMLPAGTYYVVVDGLSGTFGLFSLTLDTRPAEANDTCAGAIPIDARTGVATVAGDTTFTSDDYTGSCAAGGMPGGDLVYSIEVDAPSALLVKLTRDAATPGWAPALYLRANCTSAASSDELGCTTKSISGVSTLAAQVQAGIYSLIVDSTGTTPGAFSLEVRTRAPIANDDCTSPEPIAIDANGDGSVMSTIDFALNDAAPSGGLGSGSDVVFSIATTDPKMLEVTLLPSTTTQAAVYARSNCSLSSSELGKATLSPYSFTVTRIEAGTTYLWVDSVSSSGSLGIFTLQVHLSDIPVPRSDTCVGETPLVFDANGVATATGDTSFAANDYTGNCNGANPMTGGDVAYSFTLTAPSVVSLKLDRDATTPTWNGSVYMRRGDCASPLLADEVACDRLNGGATATLALPSVPAGTYYLIVDGTPSSSYTGNGRFTLTVTATPQIANDDCAGAEELAFVNGVATVASDTSYATNSGGSLYPCASLGGSATEKDLVYSFTLAAAKAVQVTAAAVGGTGGGTASLKPLLYLRAQCATSTTQVACASLGTGAPATTIDIPSLDAGTYYLWVDGGGGTTGPFTMTVTLSNPAQPPPTNDACARAEVLNFDVNGKATTTGSTLYAANDYQGTCSTSASNFLGNDVVYSMVLAAPSTVTAKVTPDAASPKMLAALYLRTNCTSGAAADEKGCKNYSSPGAVNTLSTAQLPAGTYYLVVEGMTGTSGSFSLEVTAVAISNDTCASPQPLTFDATGVATVTGDNTSAADDGSGLSCGSYSGSGYRDLVYSFTLTQDQSVAVDLGPGNGSPFKPVVYVRSVCGTQSSQPAGGCQGLSSGTAHLSLPLLTPGTYYVFADSATSTGIGAFQLTVTLSTPPTVTNDFCAAPTDLVLTSGRATVTGVATTYAHDDYTASCATASAPLDGGDLVYTLTLPQDASVTIALSSPALIKPAFYLRSTCEGNASRPADEVICKASTSVAALSGYVPNLPAGTYFLVLDGVSGTRGTMTLDVTTAAPVPNDTCAAPTPIPIDVATGIGSISGDTNVSGGASDDTGLCGTGGGKDLVYSFTLVDEQTVQLRLQATSAVLKPNVYARRTCTDRYSEVLGGCAYSSTAGATATATIPRLAAGTYYVFVDSYSSSSANGPFTLTITTTAPPAAPTNDNCRTGATPLVFDLVTNKATVSGIDLTNAVDDGTGSFVNSSLGANGPDVVYSFSTTQAQQVVAKVTRVPATSALEPVVYLRRVCTSTLITDELACGWRDTSADSSAAYAIAKVNNLAAGTYYVWVDSRSALGTVNLEVALTSPLTTAPANDNCSSAETLTFVGAVASTTGTTQEAANDSCADPSSGYGMYGPDVVYTFTLTQTENVTIQIAPQTSSYKPCWYLRRDCSDRSASNKLGSGQASSNGQTITSTVNNLSAGTYYLWVDSQGVPTTQGAFTLTLTQVP